MILHSREENGINILAVGGRFDAHSAPEVRNWLLEQTAAPPSKLVINLAEVTFIDSTALATLVQGMKRCRQQAGDLAVCNLQSPVRIIFELTRLDKALGLYTDEAEAMAALG
jgi:anti-sigma B factor antagonist